MDYKEEQETELQVLQSIYFDEFAFIDTPIDQLDPIKDEAEILAIESNLARFVIQLNLDVEDIPIVESAATQTRAAEVPQDLKVKVIYTPTYPETPPVIRLFDDQSELYKSERERLDAVLAETLESNAGIAVVFSVISAFRDCLENEIVKHRRSDISRLHAEELAKQEEEERRKYQGTKVTPDSFATWKAQFDKEMLQKGTELGHDIIKLSRNPEAFETNGKLTGRQLFEKDKTLISSDFEFRKESTGDEGEVEFDVELFKREMEELYLEDEENDENNVVAGFYNEN